MSLVLTPIQARVLACLIEKKETTPDQYPLTLNALKNACNQKTARNPVTAYEEGEIGHTLRELESMELVREAWGARVAKYEHRAGVVLGQHSKGLALIATLMLRGPQTPGELKNHAHRLHEFDDLEDLHYSLDRMAASEPPMVVELPRQPGQKETRFVHLLCGEPDLEAMASQAASSAPAGSLAERVGVLEQELEALKARLDELGD